MAASAAAAPGVDGLSFGFSCGFDEESLFWAVIVVLALFTLMFVLYQLAECSRSAMTRTQVH